MMLRIETSKHHAAHDTRAASRVKTSNINGRGKTAACSSQVERWFGLITPRGIKHGSDASVKALIRRIERFTEHHTANPVPFKWTTTADSFFEKLSRLSKIICETQQ